MTAVAVSEPSVLTRAMDGIRAMDPVLLLLRASLVALLVNSNDDTVVLVALAVVCLVALPRPAVLLSPWFWAALFLAIGARQVATWYRLDDHIIVTTYWCGAIALGLTATDRRATLAASARFLIGALFAFAVGWKLRSGEFVDGTFWRHAFLYDDRFHVVARLVGGTTDAARSADHDALRSLTLGETTGAVTLREGSGSAALAHVFTWWGLFIEAAVAATFLLPLRRRWGWLRHAALLTFATTTYLIVPVGGFGTLLLVLGSAQADSDRLRLGYYAAGAALLLWAGLWPAVFL